MSQFNNVSIIKQANVYFNGKVTSRSVLFEDGSTKTLGIMLPGDYEFSTEQNEIMEIMSGQLEVKLPEEDQRTIKAGEKFEVPAKSSFKVIVHEVTDYCCSYS